MEGGRVGQLGGGHEGENLLEDADVCVQGDKHQPENHHKEDDEQHHEELLVEQLEDLRYQHTDDHHY